MRRPGAPGDTPGYLAVLGMAFAATADAEVPAWQSYLGQIDRWSSADGCGANWKLPYWMGRYHGFIPADL